MTDETDPARELAELCRQLSSPARISGHLHLAGQFNVDPWSADFFHILFQIHRRIDELIRLIPELGLDQEHVESSSAALTKLKTGFGNNAMSNQWDWVTTNVITNDLIINISFLSYHVRRVNSYPKLSGEQRDHVLAEAVQLKIWLETHQLEKNDFIRMSLIDGISAFIFRVERMQWLGTGYALDSLKEVVGAYLILERGTVNPTDLPLSAATLQKALKFLKEATSIIKIAKDTTDAVQFLLKVYGAAQLAIQGGRTAGLLT